MAGITCRKCGAWFSNSTWIDRTTLTACMVCEERYNRTIDSDDLRVLGYVWNYSDNDIPEEVRDSWEDKDAAPALAPLAYLLRMRLMDKWQKENSPAAMPS